VQGCTLDKPIAHLPDLDLAEFEWAGKVLDFDSEGVSGAAVALTVT